MQAVQRVLDVVDYSLWYAAHIAGSGILAAFFIMRVFLPSVHSCLRINISLSALVLSHWTLHSFLHPNIRTRLVSC